MKLHQIHDSSNSYMMDMLVNEFAKITKPVLLDNYHPDRSNNPGNIFYILNDSNGRYRKNGCYYVLEDNGVFITAAGWNEYGYDTTIALALTRTYTAPEHRTKYYIGQYILPEIVKSTTNYKYLYITTDDYNRRIYEWFVLMDQRSGNRTDWPDIYRAFKPLPDKTLIYNVEQSVVSFDRSYVFKPFIKE